MDTNEKWESILDLYNNLLILEYSPIAALNRTFALSKIKGKEKAIREAQKLNLRANTFYHSLLGNLYSDIDNEKAIQYFETALGLTNAEGDQAYISKKHQPAESQ